MEQDCGASGGGGGGSAPPAAAAAAASSSVVVGAGSFISLNDLEQRYYSGLHLLCQQDQGSGRLSRGKVAELLKSSQLPPEALHQVTEVCGAKRLGYFGTAQFYVALKLLAAAQSGLPVRLDSITANLPLPRFIGLKNEAELRYVTQSVDPQGPPSGVSVGPVPVWAPADRGAFRHLESTAEKKETWSPPRSPCSSPPRSPSSYLSYPYGLQRNGTDLNLAYESKHCSRPIVQMDQQHASPSSYGMDQHSSPSSYGIRAAADQSSVPRVPSVERLDQRGGEEYSDDDPWRITVEQQEYYTNQFRTLQPDLGALILGTVAKNFFTKSKLPIPELSHIWELSDVDRDGALTFSEFCTAFHLIVARKNGYPLPESLPPTLRPPGYPLPESLPPTLRPPESSEQDGHIPGTPESAEPLIVFDDAEPRPSQLDRGVAERLQPALPPTRLDMKEDPCKQDFVSSPQDKHTALQFGAVPGRPEPPNDLDPQMKTRSRPRSYSSTSIDDAMKKAEEPPTPPPRPQKKSHSRASSLDLNKLFQQGGAQGIKSGWLPPPPALPPRPSASQVPLFLCAAEKTPQKKKVPLPNFADFSRFREEDERGVKPQEKSPLRRAGRSTEDLTGPPLQDVTGVNSLVPQKPVRRKYHPDSLEGTPTLTTPFNLPAKPAQKLLSRQKREIQLAIRKNKETNAVLTRLNSELQQQLKEVHQERITLESQLDILRPLAST